VSQKLPFVQRGPENPGHPVILSVPHAGRDYPAAFALLTRLPMANLAVLEDRFADALVAGAEAEGFQTLIATVPRAWMDLNRGEREYDPALVMQGTRAPPMTTAKVRGGLGIIPRRVANGGDIWRGKISPDAFEARLAECYRPYHLALAEMVDRTLAQFGVAVIMDIHSMPPITACPSQPEPPKVVIGDLYGRSAASPFADAVLVCLRAEGLQVALNSPYAGGALLEQHGAPARNVHALQIEFDRSLYLDAQLDQLGSGVPTVQRLVAKIAHSLAAEGLATRFALAAE
jgi:N-formylglutamate amidohydrolase